MLRKLIERLSRGLVLKRRLPEKYGGRPFLTTPDSALRYLKFDVQSMHPELFRIVQNCVREGSHVWDIGANVGIFAFAAAEHVGKLGSVLAVEADPVLAVLLQKSARLSENLELNVSVLCAAVADKLGIAKFYIAERGRSSNSLLCASTGLNRSQTGGVRYMQPVTMLTLDSLLEAFPVPDVIKIDVEGAEDLVIVGANRILREFRPVIFIEVGDAKSDVITRIFLENKYVLCDGEVDGLPRVERCCYNTLAVPEEKILQILAHSK